MAMHVTRANSTPRDVKSNFFAGAAKPPRGDPPRDYVFVTYHLLVYSMDVSRQKEARGHSPKIPNRKVPSHRLRATLVSRPRKRPRVVPANFPSSRVPRAQPPPAPVISPSLFFLVL